ncbi:hypothetical protein HY994_02565 [Candidatus Micrarchaeota archaeon]|nr:hypothetical protein [Candidatus Micrarchaeota archaeon]
MTPREKLNVKIIRFDQTNPDHRLMVSELARSHWTGLQKSILSGEVTKETATKAKNAKSAYEKKMNRVDTSIRDGNAFAHIAYVRGTDEWKNPTNIPVGYIFSHNEITHPLKEHLDDLRAEFPELEDLTNDELKKRVLFGEHGYVTAPSRKLRIGADLIDKHETDAQQNGKKYTHRMISLWALEAHLEEMLKKQGYKRLALRKSGAIIMAKKTLNQYGNGIC